MKAKTLCGVGVAFIFMAIGGEHVFAHGKIVSPPSRAVLCSQGQNQDCGVIAQYTPHGLETLNIGYFPDGGAPDGQIASAGHALKYNPAAPSEVNEDVEKLDESGEDRWSKVPMQPGRNTFTWEFTMSHETQEWRYYITNPDWDPEQPLARNSFDLEPFCTIKGKKKEANTNSSHDCDVPDRKGYHVILAVWDANNNNSFYQVIDVDMKGKGSIQKGKPKPKKNDDNKKNPGQDDHTQHQKDDKPVDKGTWDDSGKTKYKEGDKVTYDGKNYKCKFPHTGNAGWKPSETVGIVWDLDS